ncbi:MAG: DUF4351 domain-containing protein [Cyanobacteriota bacterium]
MIDIHPKHTFIHCSARNLLIFPTVNIIRSLPVEQPEELGEALLDFGSLRDLRAWLETMSEKILLVEPMQGWPVVVCAVELLG